MSVAPTGNATDESKVRAAAEGVFAAIMARDAITLKAELAANFILSSPGKPDQARDDFLQAISSMPYRILEAGGEDIRCRLLGDVAVLSGVQRARVEIAPGTRRSVAAGYRRLPPGVRAARGSRPRRS